MVWVHDFLCILPNTYNLNWYMKYPEELHIAYWVNHNFPKTLLEATEREDKIWKTQNSKNNHSVTFSFSAFLLRRQNLFHFCYLICPSQPLCEEIKADVIDPVLQLENLYAQNRQLIITHLTKVSPWLAGEARISTQVWWLPALCRVTSTNLYGPDSPFF